MNSLLPDNLKAKLLERLILGEIFQEEYDRMLGLIEQQDLQANH